eukprot:403350079
MFTKFAYEHMLYQFMLSHKERLISFQRTFENGYSGDYIVKEWIAPMWAEFKVKFIFNQATLSSNHSTSESHSHPSVKAIGNSSTLTKSDEKPLYIPPYVKQNQLLAECYCNQYQQHSFNMICQHIFTVFNVLQVKRIDRSYLLFSR